MTYIHISLFSCVHICTMYIDISMYVYTHTYIYTQARVHVYNTYVCTDAYMYISLQVDIFEFAYRGIYVYACMCVCWHRPLIKQGRGISISKGMPRA